MIFMRYVRSEIINVKIQKFMMILLFLIYINFIKSSIQKEIGFTMIESIDLSKYSIKSSDADISSFKPYHTAFCDENRIYFHEKSSSRIISFNNVNKIFSSYGSQEISGYYGDGGPASEALLSDEINSIILDKYCNLYIVDSGNHAIRMVDADTGIITTIAGTGSRGYEGDGGPAIKAYLYHPHSLIFDSIGNMYISDELNHCIRKINTMTKVISTIAGNLDRGYWGDGHDARSASFNQPTLMSITSNDQLFIYDTFNHRLRKIDVMTSHPSVSAVYMTRSYDETHTISHMMAFNDMILFTDLECSGLYGLSLQRYEMSMLEEMDGRLDACGFFKDRDNNAYSTQDAMIYKLSRLEESISDRTTSHTRVLKSAKFHDKLGSNAINTADSIELQYYYYTDQPTQSAPTLHPTVQAPTRFPTAAAPTMFPTAATPTIVSSAPTATLTTSPTQTPPTISPTIPAPTMFPTQGKPTDSPTSNPSTNPTVHPSGKPSPRPSLLPTTPPTPAPTTNPSPIPTQLPTTIPSANPSSNPTVQPTISPSSQPTTVPTSQPTTTPTILPTAFPTSVPSSLPTSLPSIQPTQEPTDAPSPLPSVIPSALPTSSPTCDPTYTLSTIPTALPSAVLTTFPTSHPSTVPLALPSDIPTADPTYSPSSSPSAIPSAFPTNLPLAKPSVFSSDEPTTSPSALPTASPTIVPTEEPSNDPSAAPSMVPLAIPTSEPTTLPTVVPSAAPTVVPSALPTPNPSSLPTAVPSAAPSMVPSALPTSEPTPLPTVVPSAAPSMVPSAIPTSEPTPLPTALPSIAPSMVPSAIPTSEPTTLPTALPSIAPSMVPSALPTSNPSSLPTAVPSAAPSMVPSAIPTSEPTTLPTALPSIAPTVVPSALPTSKPTTLPTAVPSAAPSMVPSAIPTSEPTTLPTALPSIASSAVPSALPTSNPSSLPTAVPSAAPSMVPSALPTSEPTTLPTAVPSATPSMVPSALPTSNPSSLPTAVPSAAPSMVPSAIPTSEPTTLPTAIPSAAPSVVPSALPTSNPSSLPTAVPSAAPSMVPSSDPSTLPTTTPSSIPTPSPSCIPSVDPTSVPTVVPTSLPTGYPTSSPIANPTAVPTLTPTAYSTIDPSASPSLLPTSPPSSLPSSSPISVSTVDPTSVPTTFPTSLPTAYPTVVSTAFPSSLPTASPSSIPISSPSNLPTAVPTSLSTENPTASLSSPPVTPSALPTSNPSSPPTVDPNAVPTSAPTANPTVIPAAFPTASPSSLFTTYPSFIPTSSPSSLPTAVPMSVPTSIPTSVPTASPSTNPTTSPSSVLTSSPSNLPTVDPSAVPTFVPTANSTAVPTISPSSLASTPPIANTTPVPTEYLTYAPTSASPSSLPSAISSTFPINLPTTTPTTLPIVSPTSDPTYTPALPTSLPTALPTALQTSLPTYTPSSLPNALPSAVPTVSPISKPTQEPTNAPSLNALPSSIPTCFPSSQPSFQPSVQPTLVPFASPTVLPSVLSTYIPTALPTLAPIEAPTNTPTLSPIIRPSAIPTSHPTTSPTYIPTAFPTDQPKGEPTHVPSIVSPSCLPLSIPTYIPSKLPSTAPLALPSFIPSYVPSEVPLLHPSLQPNLSPATTISPSSVSSPYPSIDYRNSSLFQSFLSYQSISSDSSIKYSSFYYRNTFTRGSCPTWRQLQRSLNLPLRDQAFSTLRVNYGSQNLNTGELYISTFICGSSATITSIAQSFSSGQNLDTSCNGTSVKVRNCQGKMILSLNREIQCGSSDGICPVAQANSMVLGQCSTCPQVDVGSYAVLSYDFTTILSYPMLSAPVVNMITKTSALVSVNVSRAGSIYCAAYTSSLVPLVAADIKQQGQGIISASSGAVSISLSGLIPATSYSAYCYSEVPSTFTTMPLSDVLARKTVFSTPCCRSLSISTIWTTVTAAETASDAPSPLLVYFDLSSPPEKDTTIYVNIISSNNESCAYSQDQSLSASVSPSSFLFLASSSSSGSFAITTSGAGCYTIYLTTSNAIYTNTSFNFHVVSEATSSNPPQLDSAIFSNDGRMLILTFDKPTDQGISILGNAYRNQFNCSLILSFPGASSATCIWVLNMKLSATLGSNAVVVVDDHIDVRGNSISCASTSCSFSSSSRVSIASPISPLFPIVNMFAPYSQSLCGNLTIDASLSKISGGRPWRSYQWDVTYSTSNGITLSMSNLLSYLNSIVTPTIAPISIPSSLLKGDVTYAFTLMLENFLGMRSSSSATVHITSDIIPSVSIVGSTILYRNQSLSLYASASLPSCSTSQQSLSFAWEVYCAATGLILSYPSESKNPRQFSLSAFILPAGATYIVRCYVTSSDGYSASASVSVQVISSSGVIARIFGGDTRKVSQSENYISIDASSSYTIDDPSIGISGLNFEWKCRDLTWPSLSYGSSCSDWNDVFASTSSEILSLPLWSSSVPPGETKLYEMTVIVYNTLIGSSSSSSVKLLVNSAPTFTNHVNVSSIAFRLPSISIGYNSIGSSTSGKFTTSASLSSTSSSKADPYSKLILTGILTPVSPSTSSTGRNITATWNISSDTLSILPLSTLTLSLYQYNIIDISSPKTIQFAIASGTLIPGSRYIIRLTVTSSYISDSMYTEMSITMNAPPTSGSLIISPPSGAAFTTLFSFIASGWSDDASDYPLTYAFSYQISSSTSSALLRSPSQITSLVAVVGQGLVAYDYAVGVTVTVADTMECASSISNTITVYPPSQLNIDAITQTIAQQSSIDLTAITPLINAGLSYASAMNCSMISSDYCSSIHRSPCAHRSQTCGSCLSGYIGVAGDDNRPCVSIATSSAVGSLCTRDNDCRSGYCDEDIHSCAFGQKRCPGDCGSSLNHGTCVYQLYDNTSTSSLDPDSCLEDNVLCQAKCQCNTGYYGIDCTYDETQYLSLYRFKEDICSLLVTTMLVEDLTYQSALSRATIVSQTLYDPTELSATAYHNCANVVIQTIIEAPLIAGAIDVAPMMSLALSRLLSRRDLITSTMQANIISAMRALEGGIQSQLARGEDATIIVTDNYRSVSYVVDEGSKALSSYLPQTQYESCNNRSTSHVQVNTGSLASGTGVTIASAVWPEAIADAYSITSDTIVIFFTTTESSSSISRRALASSTSSDHAIELVIENSYSQEYIWYEGTLQHATCGGDSDYGYFLDPNCSYISPSSIHNTLYCPSNETRYYSYRCPSYGSRPMIIMLSSDTSSISTSSCNITSYTSDSLHASCSIPSSIATTDSSSIQFTAAIKSIATNFIMTFRSASNLSLSTIQENIVISSLLGTLLLMILLGMIYLSVLDRAEVRRWRKERLEQPIAKHIDLSKSFTSIIPLEFSTDISWIDRFLMRLSYEHNWLCLLLPFDANREGRAMKFILAGGQIIHLLFAATILGSWYYIDDGTCDHISSHHDCNQQPWPIQLLHPSCIWTESNQSCSFNQGFGYSMQGIILLTALLSIIVAPLDAILSYLIRRSRYALSSIFSWRESDSSNRNGVKSEDYSRLSNGLNKLQTYHGILWRAARLVKLQHRIEQTEVGEVELLSKEFDSIVPIHNTSNIIQQHNHVHNKSMMNIVSEMFVTSAGSKSTTPSSRIDPASPMTYINSPYDEELYSDTFAESLPESPRNRSVSASSASSASASASFKPILSNVDVPVPVPSLQLPIISNDQYVEVLVEKGSPTYTGMAKSISNKGFFLSPSKVAIATIESNDDIRHDTPRLSLYHDDATIRSPRLKKGKMTNSPRRIASLRVKINDTRPSEKINNNHDYYRYDGYYHPNHHSYFPMSIDTPRDPLIVRQELFNLPHDDRSKHLSKLISTARAQSQAVEAEILSQPTESAQNVRLLQRFLIHSLSDIQQIIAQRYFFNNDAFNLLNTTASHNMYHHIFDIICIILLPIYIISIIFYVFLYSISIGSNATNSLLGAVLISCILIGVIFTPFRIWIEFTLLSQYANDVQIWFELLRTRAKTIMHRSKGLLSLPPGQLLTQHLNPACRVALSFPHLPASRLLLALGDYDLPAAPMMRNRRHHPSSSYSSSYVSSCISSLSTGMMLLIISCIISVPEVIQGLLVHSISGFIINIPLMIIAVFSGSQYHDIIILPVISLCAVSAAAMIIYLLQHKGPEDEEMIFSHRGLQKHRHDIKASMILPMDSNNSYDDSDDVDDDDDDVDDDDDKMQYSKGSGWDTAMLAAAAAAVLTSPYQHPSSHHMMHNTPASSSASSSDEWKEDPSSSSYPRNNSPVNNSSDKDDDQHDIIEDIHEYTDFDLSSILTPKPSSLSSSHRSPPGNYSNPLRRKKSRSRWSRNRFSPKASLEPSLPSLLEDHIVAHDAHGHVLALEQIYEDMEE